jgi:hypothetical protein
VFKRRVFPKLNSFRIAVCEKTGLPLGILLGWIVAAIWGALNAWIYRERINPDAMSYLDIANEALQHGPGALVNPYWGPFYPALIAISNLVLQPGPTEEFTYVHALNAVIYFAAAVTFGLLLRELILFRAAERGPLWRQEALIVFGFALFFCYTNIHILPFAVTPDLLLSTAVFAAAALYFRALRLSNRAPYIALGCALALGYFAKAIIFPAAVILFVVLLVCRYRSRPHVKNVLVAAGTLVLISAPQIIAISARVGHVTISEAGRLNYLWYVQGLHQFEGWTGTPGGDMPLHGPRQVISDPEVLEFATPVAGTYPLWYDPAYWYAGAKIHFDSKKQFDAVAECLNFYRDFFPVLFFPLGGLVALAIVSISAHRRPNDAECWFMLWPATMVLVYTMINIEFRYLAPWLILFFIGGYGAVLWRNSFLERVLLLSLALILLIPPVLRLGVTLRTPSARELSKEIRVTRDLTKMGINPGDGIATVGKGFNHYYAHAARVHIVAQITNADDFWSLSADDALEVEQSVGRTGAKALVGSYRPSSFQPNSWRSVAGTGYSILPLGQSTNRTSLPVR